MAKHSTSTYVLEIPPPFEKEEILPVHEEESLVIPTNGCKVLNTRMGVINEKKYSVLSHLAPAFLF
jgi:hypothetical protein